MLLRCVLGGVLGLELRENEHELWESEIQVVVVKQGTGRASTGGPCEPWLQVLSTVSLDFPLAAQLQLLVNSSIHVPMNPPQPYLFNLIAHLDSILQPRSTIRKHLLLKRRSKG
jgi:hypothetical protein